MRMRFRAHGHTGGVPHDKALSDTETPVQKRKERPPHDDPPSLAGEGDPIPSAQKTSTLPTHVVTRQGRHKGAGKGTYTYTSCSEGGGRWTIAQGPSHTHTPFGGVRNLANTYSIQAVWGQLGPTIQLIHTPPLPPPAGA
eukprot:scaffold20143_cov118-Isochrysis_galbana.AAC.2